MGMTNHRNQLRIFGIFIIIALCAKIQTYGFIDDVPGAPPKPFLFDILKGLPFWLIYVCLILPVTWFANFINKFIGSTFHLPDVAMYAVFLSYFYFLSGLLSMTFESYGKKIPKWIWFSVKCIFVLLMLMMLIEIGLAFFNLFMSPLGVIIYCTTSLPAYILVISLYLHLVACLCLFIYDKFCKNLTPENLIQR